MFLLVAVPAMAAAASPPTCGGFRTTNCVSLADIWEDVYSAVYVSRRDQGYPEDIAAAAAEGAADRALEVYRRRHP